MNSKVILYKQTEILPEKNFKVDSLVDYLATRVKIEVNDFQYIKHALELTIKIQSSQTSLDFISSNNVNYCSIQNGSETIVYYFVIAKRWISTSCIELRLRLDSVNSFLDEILLSDKTKITREHKNRWEKDLTYKYTEASYDDASELEPEVYYRLKFSEDMAIAYYTIGLGTFIVLDSTNHVIETLGLVSKIEFLSYSQVEVTHLITGNPPRVERKTFTIGNDISFAFCYKTTITESDEALTYLNVDGYLSEDYYYLPIIDKYSEGLSPVLFAKEEKILYHNYEDDDDNLIPEEQSFYLIYKNTAQPSDENPNPPVKCLLCGDKEFSVNTATKHNEIIYFNVLGQQEASLFILYNDGNNNGSVSFKYNNVNYLFEVNNSNEMVQIYKEGTSPYATHYRVGVRKYIWNGSRWNLIENFNASIFNWSEIPLSLNYLTQMRKYVGSFDLTTTEATILTYTPYWNNTSSTYTIKAIDSVDRTLSTLVKIIKLPYAPSELQYNFLDDIYLVDQTLWGYDSTDEMLLLIGTNRVEAFVNTLNWDVNPYRVKKASKWNISRNIKSSLREPKLYHSDYYQPKIVYDSFSFIFQLEKISVVDFAVNFVVTSTMNSRFMFVFDNYNPVGFATSDYYNVMPIARNNEVTLYNSAYLNYIRTGFNYDVKAKEREVGTNIATGIVSLVGAIASIGLGVASGGTTAVAGIVSGVALGFSSVKSVISTANSIAQSEANIEAKLVQSKAQSVSVAGSDDVDLMSYYTNSNKAKYMLYEVSDRMKEALYNVFYYTGYVADRFGQPDTTSRKNFNFVSAEIVFAEVPNLSYDILEDIKSRYSSGITFLHKWEDTWDFAQWFENWETALF